jgi:hypothetical protein
MELAQERTEEEDEAFLRQLVLPEEDRRRRFPASVWTGGYRWFRSPNVLCLEKYQHLRAAPQRGMHPVR